MSDPVARLNAAVEGRYRIERKLGEGSPQRAAAWSEPRSSSAWAGWRCYDDGRCSEGNNFARAEGQRPFVFRSRLIHSG